MPIRLDSKALELSLREAEEAAHLRARELAGVLEATMDCVCSLDRSWRFTFLNTRAKAYFDDGGTWLGRSLFRAFPGIRDSAFRAPFRRAMLDREASAVEAYLPRKGRWYEMNVVPSDGGITVFFRDISDRKRAEASQLAASDQMRATLDNLPQMLWAHWLDGAGEYYSRHWKNFTGVDVGEPEAPARIDLVHPDDRAGAKAAWERCRDSGEDYLAEYRLRHVSGEYRWIHSQARAERDASGKILAWYGTCTDIHERMLARAALDVSQKRFQAILDSMPLIVWSMAGDGRLPDYYNKRWYEFTGLPAGSLGGPEWNGVFHPDDAEKAVDEWRTAKASGESYEAEYRLRHHDGEYRWVVSRGRFEAGGEGEPGRWYGTCTDVHQRVIARQALDERQKQVETILDSIPQIIWSAGPDGRIDFLSNQWDGTFGSPQEMIAHDSWADLLHPDDRDAAFHAWRHSVTTGEPYEIEFRMIQPSGDYVWALVRAIPERNGSGEITRWYGTCTDIHQRVLAQDALRASEDLNRGIIEASPDCVALVDLDGKLLAANQATARRFGLADASSLVGKALGSSLDPVMRRRALDAFGRAKAGDVGRVVVQAGAKWWDMVVAPVKDGEGTPFRIVAIARDVTEQKLAEQQAHWVANHDSLTELPNRALLQQSLDEAIEAALAKGRRFALLFLDIDDFKRINDSAGHDAGDALLCEFARRLRAAARPEDIVARLSGDEFAVILDGADDEAAVAAMATTILEALREPFVFGGRILDCHASIGASLFPVHGSHRTALLKNADVALYAAKSAGGANLKIFKSGMRDLLQLRASMLRLARDALSNDSILPYYQPKVALATGAVVGFEALLRWRHPRAGPQPPDTIAAAFEDLNLSAELSDRMIGAVIADLGRWRDEGVPFGHVAINAAAAEFRRGDFAERLLARMERAGLPPAALQLEVTETVFLGRGAECVERALKTLSAAGIKIALDDFGTGYASLSHLKQFPVDVIKIDRSFVGDLTDDADDAAIIGAVVNLGRSLGIEVVAEGIESREQHEFLSGIGCEVGQGFLFGRPAPASEVPAMVLPAADRASGGAPNESRTRTGEFAPDAAMGVG